jgi:hypothetical protein
MKTFRDLISENSYKPVFNEVHKFYLKDKSLDSKQNFDVNFYSAWQELIKLEKGKRSDNKLYLVQVDADPDPSDPIIDVCMMDDEGGLFALDFIDWTDLIDMNVKKPNNMHGKECLAHILWEITFWGFSNNEVAKERKKLKNEMQDD